MNGYLAYYDGKKIEVYAKTSYEAQQKAIEILKPPKSKKHLVTVYLCEREDGSQVVHSTASI